MSVFDDVKRKILDLVSQKRESSDEKSLATEEDILKAIDDLDENFIVSYVPEAKKVEAVEAVEEVDTVQLPLTPCWSNFEYLHKPDLGGLEEVGADNRVYFTIPIGWTYDDDYTIQYWYLTFPLGCVEDDIIEFYSPVKIDDIKFPGVE